MSESGEASKRLFTIMTFLSYKTSVGVLNQGFPFSLLQCRQGRTLMYEWMKFFTRTGNSRYVFDACSDYVGLLADLLALGYLVT